MRCVVPSAVAGYFVVLRVVMAFQGTAGPRLLTFAMSLQGPKPSSADEQALAASASAMSIKSEPAAPSLIREKKKMQVAVGPRTATGALVTWPSARSGSGQQTDVEKKKHTLLLFSPRG